MNSAMHFMCEPSNDLHNCNASQLSSRSRTTVYLPPGKDYFQEKILNEISKSMCIRKIAFNRYNLLQRYVFFFFLKEISLMFFIH